MPVVVRCLQERLDIFIAYCGKGISLAPDNIRATLVLEYSPTSMRVILLDYSDSSSALASAVGSAKAFSYRVSRLMRRI